jgi:nucleotide-binding universal stress UspA family protein
LNQSDRGRLFSVFSQTLEDIMFQKILVAVDLSEMGERVFRVALSLAKAVQADLMVLHVLSLEEEGTPTVANFAGLGYYPLADRQVWDAYQHQWEAFKDRGLQILTAYVNEGKKEGVRVEFTQNPGSPGPTICAVARSWGANLILVGRRGRSGVTELLLGSVSNYVLHHATCSVMVIHRSMDLNLEMNLAADSQVKSLPNIDLDPSPQAHSRVREPREAVA